LLPGTHNHIYKEVELFYAVGNDGLLTWRKPVLIKIQGQRFASISHPSVYYSETLQVIYQLAAQGPRMNAWG
jgi:hypothetical protein